MTSTTTGDLTAIVIGSGSAGLTVGIGLAGLGRHVAVVEVGSVGGDCTNVGCIPSKTLLHRAATAGAMPWAEVRRTRDGLEAEESAMLDAHEAIDLVRGRARIVADGTVEVTGTDGTVRILEAAHVVIATGSAPMTVDIEGLVEPTLLTNETLFELEERPAHLAIVGGGAIAVEMATAHRDLGARVTMIEAAPRLLPREDPEVSAIIAESLRGAGVEVHRGTTARSFAEDGRTLTLGSGEIVDGVDRVLMAVGRRPRTAGLGLDALGVAMERGITTDTWGRTSRRGLWAVGDVTGATATTHGANAMARRTVRAIGLPWLPKIGRPPTIPGAVFGDPEVASVGLSLDELDRRWPEAARLHLRVDLADTDRGRTDQAGSGAVIVDAARLSGRILRASIVGPGAAQAIGIFTLAIDEDISMHRLYRMVHPYPTFASAIGAVADEFTRATLPNLPGEAAMWARHLPRRLRNR